MITRSKKIILYDKDKLELFNKDNMNLLNKYKIDMAVRDFSERSQEQYITNIYQWYGFILSYQNNRSVLELEDDDITEFLYYCKQQGNNTARMRTRISIISAFYKFLRKKKLLSTNPTEFIEPPKKMVPVMTQTFLSQEQVIMMREKLIELNDTQLRLYVTLSMSTLARVSAIASLRWTQIDFKTCTIHNVTEKEGKVVDLYFNEEVRCLLYKLKEERSTCKKNDHGWLFYTGRCTDTRHISPGTLEDWCKKVGMMIGVPSLHPHDFRHSAATLLRNAGMSLEDVSVLLNHESTDTTKKFYIKQDTQRINSIKSRINI